MLLQQPKRRKWESDYVTFLLKTLHSSIHTSLLCKVHCDLHSACPTFFSPAMLASYLFFKGTLSVCLRAFALAVFSPLNVLSQVFWPLLSSRSQLKCHCQVRPHFFPPSTTKEALQSHFHNSVYLIPGTNLFALFPPRNLSS